MKESTASDAKNNFGQLIDTAMVEPIAIEKRGRRVAVLMSFVEYNRLMEMEDRFWGEKALAAIENGFLTHDETDKWVKESLHVEIAAD
jgi:prevent-host-death family protein